MPGDGISPKEAPFRVPERLREPRLWVERLVVCETEGRAILRDVRFRRGLNVIWTQDLPGKRGHSAGKTLLCRLLQYVLGEPALADRDACERLQDPVVGAVIHLDGAAWCVVRYLANHAHGFAVPGEDLEAAMRADPHPEGVPFTAWRSDLSTRLLGEEVSSLLPSDPPRRPPWLTALAWITRDQGARLADALAWREHPRGALADPSARLRAALILLHVHTAEREAHDRAARAARKAVEVARVASREADHEVQRRYERALELMEVDRSTSPVAHLGVLRDRAKEHARAALVPAQGECAAVEIQIRAELDAADALQETLDRVNGRRGECTALIADLAKRIQELEGALDGLAPGARCPRCGAILTEASSDRCRKDLADSRADRESHERELAALEAQRKDLASTRRTHQKVARQLQEQRGEIVRQQFAILEASASAWAPLVEVVALDEALRLQGEADGALRDAQDAKTRVGAPEPVTVTHLSQRFDEVIRRLHGAEARGQVTRTDRGLQLEVADFGSQATAALNVVAFDLAVLRLAMEGRCALPAFLVHDSPKEADIGDALYARLFDLARAWHDERDDPAFQYIVTTTSAPPEDLQGPPWNVIPGLTGEPAEARLLRRNLR